MNALALQFPETIQLTEEQFLDICQVNPDLRLEKTATGNLIIMPPTGGETGKQNAGINAQLWLWNQQKNQGEVFDSSTGFKLPNGSYRAPDASWIPQEKWQQLTAEQKKKFLPFCPDFVIELRSPNDQLSTLQAKMAEYLENGMRLGWLIDPDNQQVEIYRQSKPKETLKNPQSLSGEMVLPQFILHLYGSRSHKNKKIVEELKEVSERL
jgi:Uma2 family endonuclease